MKLVYASRDNGYGYELRPKITPLKKRMSGEKRKLAIGLTSVDLCSGDRQEAGGEG